MESFSFDLSILILLWKRWNLERCPFFSGWFTSVKSCCWKKTQRAFKYRRNQGSFPTPEVNRVNCRPLKVGSVHLVFGSSIVDPLQRKPCYVCQPYCSGWGHIKSPKHWQSLRALDHLRLKIASPYPKSTGWRLFSLSKNCPFDGKYTSVQSHFGVPGGPSVTTSRCCNGGVCVVHLNRHLSYSGTRPTQTLQPSKFAVGEMFCPCETDHLWRLIPKILEPVGILSPKRYFPSAQFVPCSFQTFLETSSTPWSPRRSPGLRWQVGPLVVGPLNELTKQVLEVIGHSGSWDFRMGNGMNLRISQLGNRGNI